jgi:integrase
MVQKRRALHEGTVHQLSSGSLRAQISIEGKRLCHVCSTQREAGTWIKTVIDQVERGLPYETTRTTVTQLLPGWLAGKAGLQLGFHGLRHLATSVMLVRLKKSPTEVAARLGHSRTSTTTDIYGHMLANLGAETAREMDDQIILTWVEMANKTR